MGIFDGMNDIFGVGNTISQSSNTQPDDVLKTKTALAQTGHYQVPDFGITDIPDMGMIDGLKGFQQDNGLKVDGVMKPGGPTETKLGETLANQGIGNMDLLEQAKPKKPKIDPPTSVEEIKMPKLNKPSKAHWEQVGEIRKPKQTPLDQGNWNKHAQRVHATNYQTQEDTEANPSLYRTASAETSFSQPIATAMIVESDGDDKNAQAHSYDDGKTPTQRRYNRRKNLRDRKLDATKDRLRAGSWAGRKIGLDDAADHLDHFLDGDGRDRTVHRDEARKDPFIKRAEEDNRKNFEENTLLAQPSKSRDPEQRRRKEEQNRRMRNLKEGESMYIDTNDHWNQDQSNREKVSDYGKRIGHGGADDFLTYGTQKMRSTPEKVKVTRRGNKLHIEGTVEHNADDRYDFDEGSSGDWSGAYDLQQEGRAKPYMIRRRWKQRVTGTVDIDGREDGKGYVLKNPKMKWDDLE